MTRSSLIASAAAALTCLAAAPAPQTSSRDDIVVLGTRNPEQVRRDYVQQMAQAFG